MPSVQSTCCKFLQLSFNNFGLCFSYDPEYQHWDFGKTSALRETALALEAGYEYYYMGTFIKVGAGETLLITSRILHPFLYQDEIQGYILADIYARRVLLQFCSISCS